ncbi:hypothetical protein GH714_024683 [Hevea brasiliensis]|uniref:Cation/H+ exchanger transmembrane domain-containing protein n=1 Tax=Hevea brasiliensis TaxID=3981 RepID=A0A6A6M3F8_HEVBR|nr:hypothetical protein GH714_024683 [Hevea brasiliensis]
MDTMDTPVTSVVSKLQMLNTSDHASVVSMNLFVALLCACIVIGHLLEENRWMNESITALLIGVGTGVVILLVDVNFTHAVNLIVCFASEVSLRLTHCLDIGAIKFFQKLDIGPLDIGDYIAIGAIFAATDSVCTLQILNQDETPLLYSLVFGEGVVNDATSVVLFNAIQSFDLTNINPRIAWQHSTDREFALMMLMAYLSYMLAELFYLSGILTVFFCGIVMSHYTWHNVTESSRVTTKHAFATLSFVAEIFIFLYVGMDALDIEKWRFVSDSPGTSVSVSSILIALVMFTSLGHTHLRGNAIMITSTITVVLFSTVVFGLMTKPLIRFLLPHPKQQQTSRAVSSDPNTPKSVTVALLGDNQDSLDDLGGNEFPRPNSIRALLSTPTHTVHYYWRKFDNAFMRPMFGGRGFVPFVPGSPTERSSHNQWQ